MKEHFTKATVQAESWCKVCKRLTPHRIDGGRKGPCLKCREQRERQHLEGQATSSQQRPLFSDLKDIT